MMNFGSGRIIRAKGFQTAAGPQFVSGNGFPKSGTAGTTVYNGTGATKGSIYLDEDTGCTFINEGTSASPYWTPMSFDQRGMMGWYSDFRDAQGVAVAGTAASTTLTGSGLRIHGQGIAEASDSGLTISMTDQGAVAALTTTDEDAHTAVISVGNGTTPVYQPDQNGTMVIDVMATMDTNLTAKAAFVGFSGLASDALDPLMTYATTTITNVAVDIAGLTFSSELTLSANWCAVNFDEGAGGTIAAATANVGGLAAGTYQRLRVEVDADGVMRTFIDKVLKSTSAAAAVDVDEELQPMFYVESSTTAIKQANLKHFATWGKRA